MITRLTLKKHNKILKKRIKPSKEAYQKIESTKTDIEKFQEVSAQINEKIVH
jgi:hypothetical protein